MAGMNALRPPVSRTIGTNPASVRPAGKNASPQRSVAAHANVGASGPGTAKAGHLSKLQGGGKRHSPLAQLQLKLQQRRLLVNNLRNIACQALNNKDRSPSNLKQIAGHVRALSVPFDPKKTGFAEAAEGQASDRATLLVSYDFDDNLFDSSHVMRDLAVDVLTSDQYWPEVQAKLGNIEKKDLNKLLTDELLRDPSPFHGLPSLATKLSNYIGLEDEPKFYRALNSRFSEFAQEPERFDKVLGSGVFFEHLGDIKREFADKGVDIVYLIATNKERSVFTTQFANMMARDIIPPGLFDGAIAWDGEGSEAIYNQSNAKKPDPRFIYNGFDNHRTPLSKEAVPSANADDMAFIHVGDSGSSDLKLATNMKQAQPDMDVTGIVTNTTGAAVNPDAFVRNVREAVDAMVHVEILSEQIGNTEKAIRGTDAKVWNSPSPFTHLTERADPNGDPVGQARVHGTIKEKAKELAERRSQLPSGAQEMTLHDDRSWGSWDDADVDDFCNRQGQPDRSARSDCFLFGSPLRIVRSLDQAPHLRAAVRTVSSQRTFISKSSLVSVTEQPCMSRAVQ